MGRKTSSSLALTVTVNDVASKPIGQVSASVDGLGKASEGSESKIGKLDHALGAIQKTAQFLSGTFSKVEDSVRKALDFRYYGDAGAQQFVAFGRSVDALEARIGDLFIPALRGAMDALTPLIKGARDWLAANEKLAQGEIIEWAVKLSVALTRGVEFAVLGVQMAWSGWKLIVNETAGAIEKGMGKALEAFGDVSAALYQLTKAAGDPDKEFAKLAASAYGSAAKFAGAADLNAAATRKIIGDLKASQDRTLGFGDAVVATLKAAGDAAQKHVEEPVKRAERAVADASRELAKDEWLTKLRDHALEVAREAAKAATSIDQIRTAAKTGIAELGHSNLVTVAETGKLAVEVAQKVAEEEIARRRKVEEHDIASLSRWQTRRAQQEEWRAQLDEHSIQALEKLDAYQQRVAESLGSGLFNSAVQAFSAVGSVVDGKLQSISDGFAAFLKGLGTQIVEFLAQRAVIGLLKLLATSAIGGLPGSPGGGVLGDVFQFLGFSRGGLVPQRYADGGVVTGGTPGQDSVPALLTPGEYVLPTDVVDRIRRGGPSPASIGGAQAFSAGGEVLAAGRAGGLTVNASFHTMGLPSEVETDRFIRDRFAPAWERFLRRRG